MRDGFGVRLGAELVTGRLELLAGRRERLFLEVGQDHLGSLRGEAAARHVEPACQGDDQGADEDHPEEDRHRR